jgi:hypothetical protein
MTSLSDKVARVKELDAKHSRGELTFAEMEELDDGLPKAKLIAQLWDEREQLR